MSKFSNLKKVFIVSSIFAVISAITAMIFKKQNQIAEDMVEFSEEDE